MNLRLLSAVTLCVTLLSHVCLSATVPQPEKEVSGEEKKNTSSNNADVKFEEDVSSNIKNQKDNFSEEGVEIESKEQTEYKSKTDKLSESEESTSKEGGSSKKIKHDSSSSSSSSESSSSEEEKKGEKSKEESQEKNRQKRSLESNQDSLNKLDGGAEDLNNDDLESTTPTTNDDLPNPTVSTIPMTVEGDPITGETTTTITTIITEVTESDPVSESNDDINSDTTTSTESSRGPSSEVEDDGEETSAVPPSGNQSPNSEDQQEESFTQMALDRADKLSDQIRKVLYHYRTEGVVILPGKSFFPEPMSMEEFEKSFSIGTIRFKDMKVYGLSNFTVEHINTDIDKMQVYVLLKMKKLIVTGNNTLRTFWSRSSGTFNVTLLDVDSEGVAEIETTPEGHLEASDSDMNMETKQMLVNFTNLGVGNVFINAIGDAVFNSIKPQILDKVNLVIRNDVNKKLKDLSIKFINKVAPVDLAFSEGRKYVKDHGYDPLVIENQTFPVGGVVHINITDFNLKGLSKFYRVGDLSLSMDAGVIQFGVHVLTQKLTGSCKWSATLFGLSKSGKTNFTVDHLQVRALVNQSLDVRQKPQLDDLDLELGWVRVTMDSPMALSTVVEGIINSFPKLIRHMIVDAVEQPLKDRIQEILNKVNVETFVEDNLPQLDKFGV